MESIGDSSVITNLIEERTQMYSLIYDLQEKVRHTKEKIKNIDSKFRILCDHVWDTHHTGGSYSERFYICKICNIYKY